MKHVFAALFFVTLFASSPSIYAQDFKAIVGKEEKVTSADKIKTLEKSTVKVVDPNESKGKKKAKIEFKGYDGLKVLDLVFGNRAAWEKSNKLVFECKDGYKPSLETKEFLKGGVYFAVERVGSKDFSIVNNAKDGKKADLSPFYVVWTQKDKQKVDKAFFWPYQVVGVSLE